MMTLPTGCTVRHVFTTDKPEELQNIEVLYVTYVQGSKTVMEKTLADVIIEEGKLIVPMTQEETLLFLENDGYIYFQVRIRYTDGTVAKTTKDRCTWDELLKEGAI